MSENATNAPVPSTFVFLHEVATLASGTKVRFLGCIVQYDSARSRILLEHAFPKDISPVPSIWVEITLILETTDSTTLAIGTWINVIGYVQATPQLIRRKSGERIPRAAQLQAVLIWDAGAVRIGEYENTLIELMRTEPQLAPTGL
ncbi:hypothetical protein A1O7_03864 [Cladophialophora yegresii CBS 114405]|uniref:CST complex subunit Ten1 n=1 Tax=Cladophialophora yegresii CBS 114405 TaxID=1182544 RepID=W9VVN1_9EURO|nr:uncharacterized protein A1O7_03864 [Cladophialophora yegresii CBS 114405]EXJ59718.1 hypothetical protein A1O7_03864 [Cladophialophora yegresii CBS 114405]